MHPGLLAFASGGLLYVASAAVSSIQLSGQIKGLAWLGVAVVALCHAGLGFFAIRNHSPAPWSNRVFALRLLASVLVTALALTAAVVAAWLFPLSLAPSIALMLVALSVLASAVALTVIAGRVWRGMIINEAERSVDWVDKNVTAAGDK
jgi:hypothetical protein